MKIITYAFVFLIISVFVFAGQNEIRIAAASNLSAVLDKIINEFNKENKDKYKITVNYGSSGKLAAQIIEGADFDIFMSADMNYPQSLHEKSMTALKPAVYARGIVVLLSVRQSRIKDQGLEALASNEIKTIAIANPETAPYGRAVLEALKKLDLYQSVKGKLIYAENISASLIYCLNGADAGFTAKSLLYGSEMQKMKDGYFYIEIDPSLYKPIEQGIVIIKNKKSDINAVKLFYDFVLSGYSAKIFKENGYR